MGEPISVKTPKFRIKIPSVLPGTEHEALVLDLCDFLKKDGWQFMWDSEDRACYAAHYEFETFPQIADHLADSLTYIRSAGAYLQEWEGIED